MSKVILPATAIINVAAMRKAIQNALTATATGIKADFGVTTQTWNHRPTFTIDSPNEWTRVVSTDSDIYTMLNEGTRAHTIRPRSSRVLAFRTPFRSKTLPSRISSGAGSVGGAVVHARVVRHPGTAARQWDKVIAAKWDRQLATTFQRAIDSAVE